eukprot:746806-Hanusia_phi.AAC.2
MANSLSAKQERQILKLMQSGCSNLQIMNDPGTEDMEITLEQLQRIRELAGLEEEESKLRKGRRGNKFAVPDAGDVETALTQRASQKVFAKIHYKDEGALTVLKRERSIAASSSARYTSSFLMYFSQQLGPLHGMHTLLGVGLYFILLYVLLLLCALLVLTVANWILSHKLLSLLLTAACAYVYAVQVNGEPLTLSERTRGWMRNSVLLLLAQACERSVMILAAARAMLQGDDEGRAVASSKLRSQGETS